jgi:hypothetical protein
MAYKALLRTQRGIVSGIVYWGETEIGRVGETSRGSAIEQAGEIVRDHADGWITVETLNLGGDDDGER